MHFPREDCEQIGSNIRYWKTVFTSLCCIVQGVSAMGQYVSKAVSGKARPTGKMSKTTTRALYCKAEFHTMGDILKDSRLSQEEFTRLVTMLGLPESERAAQFLWTKMKKKESDWMSEDEYITLMMDPEVDAKTNMWRKLFGEFDTDGSGWASRTDVASGLKNMGIDVDNNLKAKIAAMDSNNDGRIYYGDFLKMQLRR